MPGLVRNVEVPDLAPDLRRRSTLLPRGRRCYFSAMSSTPVSPLGESPLTGPKTCDASGMVEIHRMFKNSFGEAAGLVGGVREGDTAHAGHVATQLQLASAALHAHHEGEDARLWGALETRAPACALHVGRMRQQHAVMLAHLSALDEALPAWRQNAGSALAGPVLAALGGISAALAEHLPDEEQNIVPVMEHVMTTRD